MLRGILRRPITYFDQTPLGLLINRATSDLMINDDMLPDYSNSMLNIAAYTVLIFVIMVITNPPIIVPIILILLLLGQYAIRVSKISTDLRRIAGISLAPVISNVSEIIEGRMVIQSYNFTDKIKQKFLVGMDKVGSAFMHERLVMVYYYIKITILVFFLFLGCTIGIALLKIFDLFIFETSIYAISITNLFILC